MNSRTKNSFLLSMKDKSATELTRVIITEMIPQLESRYKIDQFTASRQWRTKPTFDLPDLLCQHLPQNILLEIKKEKTKSTMIDLDAIIDHGDGIFSVPSTVNPNTEVRTVNMQDGKCTCTIVTEKKIVCRHMFRVIEKYKHRYNYTIENIDIDWFVESHKTDTSYGVVNVDQNNNKSNSNSSSNDNTSNSNTHIEIETPETQSSQPVIEDDDTGYDIPLPVSESKKNLRSFNSLRQQLKNIEAHLWDLKRRGNLFKDFRESGQASTMLTQFDEISMKLVNILNDNEDDEMPTTGFEYQSQQRTSRREAQKHLDRSQLKTLNKTSSDIPYVSTKGRPKKKDQNKKSSKNDHAKSTNNRPRRTTANYASN